MNKILDEKLKDKFKLAYRYHEEFDYSESISKLGIDELDEDECDVIDNDYEIDESLDDDDRYCMAFKLFLELTEEGFVPAYAYVGDCYYMGQGVEENHLLAEKYYLMGVDKGSSIAKQNLGTLYSDNESELHDVYKAAKYFQRSMIEDDNSISKLEFAKLCIYDNINMSAADGVEMLIELSNDFMSAADLELGVAYFEGLFIEQDYNKAFEYLHKEYEESEEYSSDSSYLAACYFEGAGVEQNINLAIDILTAIEESTRSNHYYEEYNSFAVCCYYLGLAYYKGLGHLPLDISKGIAYLTESAELNWTPAMNQLAIISDCNSPSKNYTSNCKSARPF